MNDNIKKMLTVALAALSAGVFLRFVSDDDEESRIVKTVVSATISFGFAAIGGLALLASPLGALALAGAAAFSVVVLALGKGSFDTVARTGFESATTGAQAARQRAEELKAEAKQNAKEQAAEQTGTEPAVVRVDEGAETPPPEEPGVSEPVSPSDD